MTTVPPCQICELAFWLMTLGDGGDLASTCHQDIVDQMERCAIVFQSILMVSLIQAKQPRNDHWKHTYTPALMIACCSSMFLWNMDALKLQHT